MSALQVPTPRAFLPLLGDHQFKGASGGRGGAKSHFFAENLILDTVSEHIRAACLREVQLSIKDSIKQLIEDKIHKFGLTGSFRITDREIVYPPTDSLFVFRGLQNHTAASIKSLEGFNRALYEEAQTLSQRSLDLAIPTFRAPGAQQHFAWNPYLATDPVDKFFKENADDPDFAWVKVNYYDNPWFPPELRSMVERDKKRDPDKYAHIWLGEYIRNSEARVFRNYRVESFETPADARFYQGADWGFAIDPTVLVRMFIREDVKTIYIDREVYAVGCEIDNTPALFDKLDPDNLKCARDWPTTADSARPETISYMNRHGYPRIKGAVKGPASVADGVEFLKSYDIVIHPRCTNTVDEFAMYSYKVDPKTNEILPVLEDKKNHVIDSVRYALEGTRRSQYNLRNI